MAEVVRDNAAQSKEIQRLQAENAELRKAQSRLRSEVSNAVHKAALPCKACQEKEQRHQTSVKARETLLEDLRQAQASNAETGLLVDVQAACAMGTQQREDLEAQLGAVQAELDYYKTGERSIQALQEAQQGLRVAVTAGDHEAARRLFSHEMVARSPRHTSRPLPKHVPLSPTATAQPSPPQGSNVLDSPSAGKQDPSSAGVKVTVTNYHHGRTKNPSPAQCLTTAMQNGARRQPRAIPAPAPRIRF